MRSCPICQAAKSEAVASPGLLQPLPIPSEVWTDISMAFISELSKAGHSNVIFMVVDRLSKYANFMTLSHPYSAVDVAQVYLDNVYKLHGWPRSIVSYRDPIFPGNFWKALFTIQGTDLLLFSAHHPQTNGQTEVVNKCLETHLRCMILDCPSSWNKWLPLAEWWYKNNFHSSAQVTPYEIVYNQPPPLHMPYIPGKQKLKQWIDHFKNGRR